MQSRFWWLFTIAEEETGLTNYSDSDLNQSMGVCMREAAEFYMISGPWTW